MRDTFWSKIISELNKIKTNSRFIVWVHNSHIYNAYKTNNSKLNIGMLLHQLYKPLLIGMMTNTKTVSASRNWNGKRHTLVVRPTIKYSYEHLFHKIALKRKLPKFIYNVIQNK